MCPAGVPALTRVADNPCKSAAVTPVDKVSYGFNARLDREAVWFRGRIRLAPAYLDSSILDHGQVPIVFDVDGRQAVERGKLPYFSAPPVSLEDEYHGGDYWFPPQRHGGQVNVAFTGGHVLSSKEPASEPDWDWDYQQRPCRVP